MTFMGNNCNVTLAKNLYRRRHIADKLLVNQPIIYELIFWFYVRIQVSGWGKRDGWDVPLPDFAIKACLKNSMTDRPCRRQVCTTLSKSAV